MNLIDLYLLAGGIILAYVLLIWLASLLLKNASIMDIFWGPGFVLLALAGFYWWSRNRQVAEPVVARGGRQRRKGRSGDPGAAGFCSQCGHALSADDNFCPRCGTPRRKG